MDKHSALFSILLLLSPLLVTADLTCPDSTSQIGNLCVNVTLTLQTSVQAEETCRKQGGHLVSIHNTFDNNHLVDMANTFGLSGAIRIGMQCSDTSCAWIDGTPANYYNFQYNQIQYGGCVYLLLSGQTGRWHTASCEQLFPSLCAFRATDPDGSCTIGSEYEKNCYEVASSVNSYVEAAAVCEAKGGSLVSIHSEKENDFVWNLFDASTEFAWLGLSYSDSEKNYTWFDESAVDYFNFEDEGGNPDAGSCVFLAVNTDNAENKTWFNADCNIDINVAVVCKYNGLGPYVPTTQSPRKCPTKIVNKQYSEDQKENFIFSPGFPTSYTGDENVCTYFLTVTKTHIIGIRFPVFEVDKDSEVDLYAGQFNTAPFMTLSGTIDCDQWFNSTSNVMKLVFRTNGTKPFDDNFYVWQAEFTDITSPFIFTVPPSVQTTTAKKAEEEEENY